MVEPAVRPPIGPVSVSRPQLPGQVDRAGAGRSAFAVGAVAVATALAVAAVVHLAIVTERNGCIFTDGDNYCRMVRGGDGDAPFSRRPVIPAIVSVLPHSWSVVTRFEVIAVLSAVIVVVGTFALTYRLIPADPALRTRRLVAALAVADLVAVSPHTFRLAFSVPVLVDLPASALGLCWVLLLLARRRAATIAAVLCTVPLILTREAWALPLAAVVVRLAFLRRWWTAGSIAVLVAVSALVGTLLPHARPYPLSGELRLGWTFLKMHPGSPIWRLGLGVGLLPAILVLLLLRRYWPILTAPAMSIVVLIGVCHLAQAPIGGSDVPRIASAALPFLLAASAAAAVRIGSVGAAAGLGVATAILWQPWRVIAPGTGAYDAFYYPSKDEAVQDAIGLSIAVVLVLAGYWSARREARAGLVRRGSVSAGSSP